MQIIGIKYPNINSKLKGMYAKKITKDDLEDLIKQSNFKNVVAMLKDKDDIFKNVDENIDRIEIETLLDESLINYINKIMKLLSKKHKYQFKLFLLRYEIKCIKSIFRKFFSEDNASDIIVQNVKKWGNSLFDDIKGIENANNFEEFFYLIRSFKYNKIVKKYQNKEKISIFEFENDIDKEYFETIYKASKGVYNYRKIIGSEIDLLNILWIYRVKKYYNYEKDKIQDILIKRYYKLNYKIINKIIDANLFEEIKEILKTTIYKNVFTEEIYIEQDINKFLYNINKNVFRKDISSMAYIYAYINLLEYENNDIINTIEGIRYNMDKEEILKRLAR